MPRLEAFVKPALLVWARESFGLTVDEAAKRAKLPAAKLESWEAGEARPTVGQLKKLAAVYKRPLGVFFLASPPKGFTPMRDFRRLPTEISREFSPALLLEMRRAQFRQNIARELAEASGAERVSIRAVTTESAEVVAARLRDALNVSVAMQRAWKGEIDALNNWKRAVEHLGVLVFQFGKVDVVEARGFSSFDERAPLVAINSKDAVRGRIFSLFHELAHVSLRTGGVCDWLGASGDTGAIETLCNRIAASLLIPRMALLSMGLVREHAGHRWLDRDLAQVADTFYVSREAALLRLVEIGKASQSFYQEKRAELLEEYRQLDGKKRFGRGTPVTKTVARLGVLFPRIVLEAHHSDLISAGEVSDYLDLKLKHLGAIERAVFERVGSRA